MQVGWCGARSRGPVVARDINDDDEGDGGVASAAE